MNWQNDIVYPEILIKFGHDPEILFYFTLTGIINRDQGIIRVTTFNAVQNIVDVIE